MLTELQDLYDDLEALKAKLLLATGSGAASLSRECRLMSVDLNRDPEFERITLLQHLYTVLGDKFGSADESGAAAIGRERRILRTELDDLRPVEGGESFVDQVGAERKRSKHLRAPSRRVHTRRGRRGN